ncbi:MAG: deoxyguanosinetriphosphate triphosphohydrolase [candidate division Zixibacteria bacterium]|nr:deoxyguanosinetriphosphate triphosphohydrolase [candidate division Zixibacteria bacterium]
MLVTREDLQEIENRTLSLYAVKSAQSRGRKYPEPEDPFRTCFQRDRDRVVHSKAFRRLEYKTQVFVFHEGDHYRTRLTHTMEVAGVSQTIARNLGVNQDLAITIALAHDLGHPPFGHSGERALNRLMQEHGGFDHNKQSLRVIEQIEWRYPDFPGLNLAWETREGIVKHNTPYDTPDPAEFEPGKCASIEAQIANLADEITYNTHDIDDCVTAGFITLDDIRKLEICDDATRNATRKAKHLDETRQKYQIVRALLNLQITDVVHTTHQNLETHRISSVEDVRNIGFNLVNYSEDMIRKNTGLREFLRTKFYEHYRVMRMSRKATRFLEDLFEEFRKDPRQLPPAVQRDLHNMPLERAICDYIAGMTDRYALDEHKRLFDPYERV